MTVIVSVKINDGVVLAADSAGSMGSGQVYAHANKVANLCQGLPVGAMSTGSGGIGNEFVETFSLIVFIEKVAPAGRLAGRVFAFGLVAWGLGIIVIA